MLAVGLGVVLLFTVLLVPSIKEFGVGKTAQGGSDDTDAKLCRG